MNRRIDRNIQLGEKSVAELIKDDYLVLTNAEITSDLYGRRAEVYKKPVDTTQPYYLSETITINNNTADNFNINSGNDGAADIAKINDYIYVICNKVSTCNIMGGKRSRKRRTNKKRRSRKSRKQRRKTRKH